jgi:peptidyl-prolyl cis-trans isomerase SurA
MRRVSTDTRRFRDRPRGAATIRLLGFLAAWLASSAIPPAGAEEIDRVIAAVNGRIIAESDLRLARNLNALLVFGKQDPGSEPARAEQISRLIDLELIRQELESFPLDPGEQTMIETRVEELKSGYAEIGGIEPIMRRLGLRPDELQSYLRLQASILRFVNLRFRPFVSVTPEDVSAYYREKLVPRLQNAKAAVPPVEQVSPGIEDILKEEKVSTALDNWIREIREHSRIEYLSDGTLHAARASAGSSAPAAASPGSGGASSPIDSHKHSRTTL